MALISFYRSKLTTRADAVERITSVATLSNGTANLSRRRFILKSEVEGGFIETH